jgi:Rrf2 family transcriptional regulator, iron-sulfur cluster assembly transcription factor
MISLTLSSTAEYALRAMACLSLLPETETLNSAMLAERTAVPQHYLNKVMRKLVEGGLVLAARGHGGGFQLAKPPELISFRHILKVVGYETRDDSCVFGWGKCREAHPCPLHQSWKDLNKSFVSWAEKTKLSDVRQFADENGIVRKLNLPFTTQE